MLSFYKPGCAPILTALTQDWLDTNSNMTWLQKGARTGTEISHLLDITILTSGPSYPCVLWVDGRLIKLHWSLWPQQQCSLKGVEAPLTSTNTLSLSSGMSGWPWGHSTKLTGRTASSVMIWGESISLLTTTTVLWVGELVQCCENMCLHTHWHTHSVHVCMYLYTYTYVCLYMYICALYFLWCICTETRKQKRF